MQLEHLRGFVGAAQAVAEDAQRFELVGREAHQVRFRSTILPFSQWPWRPSGSSGVAGLNGT